MDNKPIPIQSMERLCPSLTDYADFKTLNCKENEGKSTERERWKAWGGVVAALAEEFH